MTALGALTALTALTGCKPANVNEAEARGDVAYLVANASPEAVAALGRLADKDTKARTAVQTRAESDLNAYIAAWSAAQRGATWGNELIKAGLRQPARAELAAAAMTRGDPKLIEYVPDLSSALVAAGAREPRVTVAAMLASTSASSAVKERLRDKSTRGNMCRGLASPDASAVSRQTLLSEPADSRDDPACLDSVVRLATHEDATMTWLADSAEPGLLTGAGKGDAMPCARLAQVWTRAMSSRPREAHGSLAVPLAHAIKRCPTQFDVLLEGTLTSNPVAVPLVVSAIDPYGAETSQLAKSCKALARASAGTTGRTKDRASDALSHGCKGR